jgi:DNA-binding MarR family transcriptional regulator
MSTPPIGEGYRGVEGNTGYLLSQTWHTFRGALDSALRKHNLSGPQYAVLSVLRRDPGLSGADLARACNTTPQAMNGVLAILEREGLVARSPHPTHGRILRVGLTPEGQKRLDAATPSVRALERMVERDLGAGELATVKAWLVDTARRLSSR